METDGCEFGEKGQETARSACTPGGRWWADRWEDRETGSSGKREVARPFQTAHRASSPRVTQLAVDQRGLNRPVAEEVPDEVDRLACVEEMDGRRMTQHVNVPARDGQGSLRCVMAKEHLKSADFQ